MKKIPLVIVVAVQYSGSKAEKNPHRIHGHLRVWLYARMASFGSAFNFFFSPCLSLLSSLLCDLNLT